MRRSLARASLVVACLASGGAAGSVGCTSILGDYSSGTGGSGTDGASDVTVGDDGTAEASQNDTFVPSGDSRAPMQESGVDTSLPPPVDASGNDVSDAAPWTPTVLDQENALAVWLEASTSNVVISSSAVAQWTDLSQNHNNAGNALGSPVLENMPPPINGHNAVHFGDSNTNLTITDAASLQFGTDQFCMAVVARTTTGVGTFWAKSSYSVQGAYQAGLEFFVNNDGQDDAGNPIVDDAGVNVIFPAAHINPQSGNEIDWSGDPALDDGHYHVVVLRRTSAFALSLTFDQQKTQSTSTGMWNISLAGNDILFGGVRHGTFMPAVDLSIAELVVIHRASGVVADNEVASLSTYLLQKYAL
jgi:hypothetical protein